MSRVTPDIGTPCLSCDKPIDRVTVRHHSHGLCEKCYIRAYHRGYRGKPKEIKKMPGVNLKKNDSCLSCNVVYANAIKTSGRYGAKGMCKKCYHKFLLDSRYEKCDLCGGVNLSSKPTCMMCRKVDRDTQRLTNEILSMESIYNNNIASTKRKGSISKPVEYDMFLRIKMLLIKYKWGMNTKVDDFRVCDIYYSLYSNDFELDGFKIESQVNYMLRVLKKIYELNKRTYQ